MFGLVLSPLARYAACALISLALGGGMVWKVQAWRYGSQISTLEADHAKELKKISDAAAASLLAEQVRAQELQEAISQADLKHSKEMRNANYRIARLRADLRSGAQQLRIDAGCIPDNPSGKTPATASPGLGDGTPAAGKLCGSVAENLAVLAGDADEVAGRLRALQEYVHTIRKGDSHE